MRTSDDQIDTTVSDLQERSYREGGVFRTGQGELCVFEAAAAQRANAANFHDLTLPPKLMDLLRWRDGEPVSWRQVRAAWAPQLKRISEAEGTARLAARMSCLLDERLDRPLDLVWVAQNVCTQALVPSVIDGLSDSDLARVLRDQSMKLERLLAVRAAPRSLTKTARDIWVQVSAGLAVRRELGGRAARRRPRRIDLADPMVDMLPALGMDRAVHAVTTILTAIAGPPGAVAACLLFELTQRPAWTARLTAELLSVPLPDLYRAPARSAPLTHRFVKETLRKWSAPALFTRIARAPIDLGQARIEVGQTYHVSPFILHHDPRYWNDPDVFDPDRWLDETDHGGYYVPFGWSPTACIGAGLGTIQLMVLCHLVCTRYSITLSQPCSPRIVEAAVPLPVDFCGTITRR